ncbi:DUF998 domain-containing protein [Dactylosporangium sp. NPDC048998]|uniref:DUF998 domain-containing protein n=1 Tax=Dactylosporangium sp. NPDC048998 TaxID=3363976 RepID=UPI00371578CF
MSTTIGRAPEPPQPDISTEGSPGVLRRVLLAAGIGTSLFYVVALVLGPMRWEGYSSIDQTISELFAVDAPSRPLVVSLLFVSGVLALAFGFGVLWSAGRNRALRVTGWALAIVGVVDQAGPFFPMHMRDVIAQGGGTFSDTMHITLTIVLSLLFLLAMTFGAVALGKRFRVYSVATILTLLAFGAMASMQADALATNEPTPWQGVYERINVAAYLLWMAVLAIVLLRTQRDAPVEAAPDTPGSRQPA